VSRKIRVSIIVNNFNYGRFLDAAIASALEQTYPRTEVIVVDDGSTDNSSDIIRRYGNRVIPVFKKNGGQASAFNAGFAQSTGDVVIFLDSDDVLLPTTAQMVVERFSAHPEISKLQYRLEVIDESGRQTGIIKPPWNVQLPSGDLLRQALASPFDLVWVATSGNAFSAQVLRRIMPVPEGLYGAVGADWYVILLALLCGSVETLEEVGAYYRIHNSNFYEVSPSKISLRQVRQSVIFMEKTSACLRKFAEASGLLLREDRQAGSLSIAYVAHRMISLKLDPEHHPIEGDRTWELLQLGLRASVGRFDVPLLMKGTYMVWFVVMSLAPKPLAKYLAQMALFPNAAGGAGRLLKLLRGRRDALGRADKTRVGHSSMPTTIERGIGASR
jgi:hypothetical protein